MGEVKAKKPGEVHTWGCIPKRSMTWKNKTSTFREHLYAKFFHTFNELINVKVDFLFKT